MSKTRGVIHIGSFSKSIAPALRVGYIVAPWAMLSRMLALKTDAGSGALEQMVLAEYCAPHFATHVPKLTRGLRAKLETLMDALNEQFGTAAEFDDPKGGIFLWVKLPDKVDTLKLYQRRSPPASPSIRAGMVDRQDLGREPHAAVLRQPLARADSRRGCGAGRGLPQANSACPRGSRMWSGWGHKCRRGAPCGRPRRQGRATRAALTGSKSPCTTCATCSTSAATAKQCGDELAPFLEVGRAAKIDGVVLDRLPSDEQAIARGLLDRAPAAPWRGSPWRA